MTSLTITEVEAQNVPEPPVILLFATGIPGFLISRRRQPGV
ncbi:MAG: PEP-CTERM sorting domain-containing protein [Candidatus Thiodiazotropha sp.]